MHRVAAILAVGPVCFVDRLSSIVGVGEQLESADELSCRQVLVPLKSSRDRYG